MRRPLQEQTMKEPKSRILVVDDEEAIRRFLRTSLSARGHTIFEASSGQEALSSVVADRPDVIILDLGLPDVDGVDVVRQLREWSQIPITILSVRDREADKIEALDAGADDYLTKPFGLGELLARLRATLRRANQTSDKPVFTTGELEADLRRRVVTVAGEEVQLTPTEYELLRALVMEAGKVLTHRYLLRQVWGPTHENDVHLLRVNISNLRQKLEPEPARPRYIITEPGVGYRLRTGM